MKRTDSAHRSISVFFNYSNPAACVTKGIILGISLGGPPVFAEEYFNPEALELKNGDVRAVDLKSFSSAGDQLPGRYRSDIYLNGRQIDTYDVDLVEVSGRLVPELNPAQLKAMGVKTHAFPELNALSQDRPLTDLNKYIPDAGSAYDFAQQRVEVSIPQAALEIDARNQIDPALWDQGLTSTMLNYSYSGSSTSTGGKQGDYNSNFLNLRGGINVGAWRLRNYSTYSDSSGNSGKWQSINTYLERDIHSIKSQLTLGDSATPSEVYDSVQFRGVQLSSDENMVPDSLRGFAPVIRGIAQSNAQVTIRQNGYVIYQTYVAPGAFEITDLYPSASSGDLEVVIRESDGTERISSQPFSAVPVMQREGQMKYSATAGEYRSSSQSSGQNYFGQGSLIYGLPWSTTVYGGAQGADNYQSVALGIGHSFNDWGAVSADTTHARTQLVDGNTSTGQSFRFQYAKDIVSSGTTFTLAGYRYSTSGFYDLREAQEMRTDEAESWRSGYNKRSKAQININQSLAGYGSFYVSASQQDYWKLPGKERTALAGYNVTLKNISYGLSYSASSMPGNGRDDKQLYFSVQVPLDKYMAGTWARYGLVNSKKNGTTHSTSLSGTALDRDNLSWRVEQNYDRRNQGYGGDMSADYKGSYGEVGAGYRYDRDSRQLNYSAQGSVVAHPYGVTFSQPLGETAVLVRAPGAADINVQSNIGIQTDWRGYAVVPYANTYRHNRIALDTNSFSEDIDIDNATVSVVPTKGALALAEFNTRVGSRVLMTLDAKTGRVPFGATASISGVQGNSSIVGDDGQVYLSGMPERGVVDVKWGHAATEQCKAEFDLSETSNSKQPLKIISSLCQ